MLVAAFFVLNVSASFQYYKDPVVTKRVWAKVNLSAGSNSFIINNLSDTYKENPDGVFIFFDDFDDASYNTSKWTTYTGSPSEASGYLQLSGTTKVYSDVDLTSSIWEARVYKQEIRILGIQPAGAATVANIESFEDNPSREGVLSAQSATSTITAATLPDNIWNVYKIKWMSGTSAKFYVDNSSIANHTTNVYTSSTARVYFYTYISDTELLRVDWIRIREYAADEPNVSIKLIANGSYRVYVNSSTTLTNYQLKVDNVNLTGNLSLNPISLNWLNSSSNNTLNLSRLEKNATGRLEYSNTTLAAKGEIQVLNATTLNFSANITSSGYKNSSGYFKINQTTLTKDSEVDGSFCTGSGFVRPLDTVWAKIAPDISRSGVVGSAKACFVAEATDAGVEYNITLKVNNNTIAVYNISNFTTYSFETKCAAVDPSYLVDGINNITLESDAGGEKASDIELSSCSRSDGGNNSITYASTDQGSSWTLQTASAYPLYLNTTNNVTGTNILYDLKDGETGWINLTTTYQGVKTASHVFNISLNKLYVHKHTTTVIPFSLLNETFDTAVLEGQQVENSLIFNASNNVSSIKGNLTINNTKYSANVSKIGNRFNLSVDRTIKEISGNATIDFYWNYSIVYNTGEYELGNTTTKNQTLYEFNLEDCNGSSGKQVYVVYTRDEATDTALNTTLEILGTIYTDKVTKNLSFTFNTNDTHFLCALPVANVSFNSDLELTYSATGYEVRKHYISDKTNVSDTSTIILYTANTSATDLWTVYVKRVSIGVNHVKIDVLRRYNGISTVVATKYTDVSGLAQFDLYTQTVDYSFNIYDENGELVISTFPSTLLAGTGNSLTFSLTSEQGFSFYSLTEISANCTESLSKISCSVYDPSGVSSDFNLKVSFTNAYNGTTTVCNTLLSTSSGVLSCQNLSSIAPDSNGCFSYTLYVTNSNSQKSLSSNTNSLCRPRANFGINGGIIALLILLSLVVISVNYPLGEQQQKAALTISLAFWVLFVTVTNIFVIPFAWMIVAAIILLGVVTSK